MRKMTTMNWGDVYRDFMIGKQENPLKKDYALGCHEGFEYGWSCGARQTHEMYCGKVYDESFEMAIRIFEKILKRETANCRGLVKWYDKHPDMPSDIKKLWDYSKNMVAACNMAIFALHEIANKETSKQVYENGFKDGYETGYSNAKLEASSEGF